MTDYPDIAARFARDTADHRMTVLHDDGLYRHLRFAPLDNSLYWWDLLTWPYNLIVNGSHDSFHFCRFGPDTEDMLVFFRSGIWRDGSQHINPGYWGEKVRAGEFKSWSEPKFRAWVTEEAAALEARYPGTVEAVGRQILHSDEHSTEYEETARFACNQFRFGEVTLRFPDNWDLSFEDFDWRYLWQCHATVAGIAQYDAARKQVAA
ncbi:hypothetical protein [Streptomyces candidus]|uniref:Uncharacterized protein n=1 Tax=Streptomyces candidus TaxID=67283 RepID=A0A7X0HP18_9ACTN|nr:hypothetical protein [Streptomyces candidus]MBB6439897.1 hypothetical protein [Streptomyces candidus]GHH58103.1 hypothetical protein GCM10018773_66140 [Streptomyces candidus]